MDRSELKIGIFGGCFDPVHLGHLIIAETARQQFDLNKIIFIPAGIPPHRPAPVAPAVHRLKMTEIAVQDNSFFETSDIEIKREGISYTYETMKILSSKDSASFFIIIGWDSFVILPSWFNAHKLAEEFEFIVAPRSSNTQQIDNFPFEVRYKMLDIPRIDISSTLIRSRIKSGKSIRYLVPEKVLYYIEKERLYV
ncbi:MAG: nicotinate-nucleotide adenylyltransferase [Candidatus Omnitrophica bacterium]|nr:nicotinate-nucleotide adenylyltransferase [Candidatus Omnitrophota bacterium]MCM8817001.1 nicotinate-nucleotide adenylyltransferase [Candidatus Omnitrophota bacterium]